MKKLLLIALSLFLFVGCDTMNTPKKRVDEYLGRYTSHHNDVISDLNLSAESENLDTANTEIYMDVMKRQYKDIKYEITDEKIDGDEATVTVKVTVYDLYKIDKASLNYLNENRDEFLVNDVYDESAYIRYKLNEMTKAEETIDYTLDFYLNKVDKIWVVEQPDKVTKEKIHGIYNYEG